MPLLTILIVVPVIGAVLIALMPRRRAELVRWLALGLLGSMAVFLSHGLVDNSYFLVDLAFAFFLTAGLVQRLEEQTTTPSGSASAE